MQVLNLETHQGPPGRSQSMHAKRKMVCTGLPEAMLINRTTLTMTRVGQHFGAFGPSSVLSNLCRLKSSADLNGAHLVFNLNLAKISAGRPTQKLTGGISQDNSTCDFSWSEATASY